MRKVLAAALCPEATGALWRLSLSCSRERVPGAPDAAGPETPGPPWPMAAQTNQCPVAARLACTCAASASQSTWPPGVEDGGGVADVGVARKAKAAPGPPAGAVADDVAGVVDAPQAPARRLAGRLGRAEDGDHAVLVDEAHKCACGRGKVAEEDEAHGRRCAERAAWSCCLRPPRRRKGRMGG
jgi:hypothetical protein